MKKIDRLKIENSKLTAKLATLEGGRRDGQAQLMNTLSSLVSNLSMQSNLTSFNPIIQNNIYVPISINWQILTFMYKTHGVIQTAIDMPVLDALRGGLELHSGEMDVDDMKELQKEIRDKELLKTIGQAEVWARLYGGSGLIINTYQDPETPLDLDRVTEFELYAANRWELTSDTGWKPGAATPYMSDAGAAINSDYFLFYGKKIHASRVITITGKEAPYVIKWQLAGWGMSEVERMVEDFNTYIRTKEVLYQLLEEAKIDVYRFEGLSANMATDIGQTKVQQRVEAMNKLKNFQHAVVMDKLDEFDQKQITYTGIAEVMKENRIGIASALRMPMTKLFGISASGFNSGEDDIENYNAMVESEVREKLRTPIQKVLNLLMRARWGEEFDLDFEYKPLRVLGAPEEETVKASKHNRYVGLYDHGLLDSKELGEIMEKEKMVPIETKAARGVLDDHPDMGGGEGDESEGKKGKGDGEKK